MRKSIYFIIIFIFCLIFSNSSRAQGFSFGGYVDFYYAFDTDKNGSDLRQLSAIAPVRDQFRINIAQISGSYQYKFVRANATFQFGDIPRYNWPQAPDDYMQYIQEANVGIMLSKTSWLDFGFFLTHIGAEGLIPLNNIATTLALPTYFEPFYQSGIRISNEFSPKFSGSLFLLNGYNVLADNNKNKSVGAQIVITPSDRLSIAVNNITGNEQPSDVEGKTRIYNNLVVNINTGKVLDILFGGDLAIQEKSQIKDPDASALMYGALLTMKFRLHKKINTYVRGDIFRDDDGFMSGITINESGEQSGLKAYGVTLGVEFKPMDIAYLRLEGRYMATMDGLNIFTSGGEPVNHREEVVFTSGVMFP